eukprot:gene1325-1743_t
MVQTAFNITSSTVYVSATRAKYLSGDQRASCTTVNSAWASGTTVTVSTCSSCPDYGALNLVLTRQTAYALSLQINTFVGTGTGSSTGNLGPVTSATVNGPRGVQVDTLGNVYINEYYGRLIRKVTSYSGIITLFGGTGGVSASGDGGPATSASMPGMTIFLDSTVAVLYLSAYFDGAVRTINLATNIVSRFAGSYTNNTVIGKGDGGPATSSQLTPMESWGDRWGNLYIADEVRNNIRKVTNTTRIISTFAGSSTGASGASLSGIAATSSLFRYMEGLW